jgi:hypothetical protein
MNEKIIIWYFLNNITILITNIIDDSFGKKLEKDLNFLIQNEISKRQDYTTEDEIRNIQRSVYFPQKKILALCKHSSLQIQDVLYLLLAYLKYNNIEYELKTIKDFNEYPEFFPYLTKYNEITKSFYDGPCPDSRNTFDYGTKELCDIMNQYEGIETFGSCNGHEKRPYYIAFHFKNHIGLVKLIKNIQLFFNKKKFKKYFFEIFLSYNDWSSGDRVYVDFRIVYNNSVKELVNDVINPLVEFLKENINTNIPVKNA